MTVGDLYNMFLRLVMASKENESGTINFTINSVYIDELDNYTSGLLVEELSQIDADTNVYLYDDDSKEYYGIHVDGKNYSC